MSIVLTNIVISPIISSTAITSKLIMAPVAFTEYQDLMLGTSGLNAGSHVTMYIAKTILVHEKPFTL